MSAELDRLVDLGELQPQPPRKGEIDRILQRAAEYMETEQNIASGPLSVRFNLAYNAAHAIALGALRMAGYRPVRRGMVFQCVALVLPCSANEVKTLVTAHDIRNQVEYHGALNPHPGFVEDLLKVTRMIQDRADSQWQNRRPTLPSAPQQGNPPTTRP